MSILFGELVMKIVVVVEKLLKFGELLNFDENDVLISSFMHF